MRVHGRNLGDGVFVYAAVDADEELGFPLEEGLDFGRDVVEEEFFSGVRADAEEEDVVDLIEKIGEGVRDRLGVDLELQVEIW